MKKLVQLLALAVMTFLLFGCSSTKDNNPEDKVQAEDLVEDKDGQDDQQENAITVLSLEEIISKTYENSGLELPKTGFIPLNKENQTYMLGTDTFDFLEGVVSEPMMSSIAHSFVLFTVEDGADIEGIKEAIRTNIDVRKWICVSVEPEQVVVENFGNTIVLILEERSDVLYDTLKSIME